MPIFPEFGALFLRTSGGVTIYGFLPVVFMCLGSVLLMAGGSWLNPAASKETLAKYFPARDP